MRAFIIKAFIYICSLLPLRVSQALGASLARLLIIFPNKPRLIAEVNIRLCFPNLSAKQQKSLVHQSLIETGKTVAETGALWMWPKTRTLRLVRKVSGKTAVEQALQQGRGIILAAPHIGAWEMSGLYWASQYPLTALYKPPQIKQLDNLIHHARERSGGTLVPTDIQGVKALIQALKRKEFVGILPDQDPGDEGGVFAPFFDIPTNTMALLPRIANKTNAAVFFTFAERLPKGQGFHIHAIPADPNINAKDLLLGATCLNKGVEQCIKISPEQYQWIYKRFKKRPAGESNFYQRR